MDIKLTSPSIESNNKNQSTSALQIIGREACIYRCLNLSDTHKKLQRSSLDIQIKALSPFKKYNSYIIWKNSHAMFWLWEQADESPLRVLPESLFYSEVKQSQSEIIQLDNGFEARYWNASILRGSQYWKEKPSLDKWNNFLRHHSQKSQTQLPEIKPSVREESPWHQPSFLEKLQESTRVVDWPMIAATIFLIVISYQLASIAHINQTLAARKVEHEQALEKASDIVTARNNAVRELSIIKQINELSKWPSQIELLAICNQTLKELDAKMISWKFDDGEILLVIQTKNTDSTAFVANFENTDLFSSVNLDTQSNQNNFSLQLTLKPLTSHISNAQIGEAL